KVSRARAPPRSAHAAISAKQSESSSRRLALLLGLGWMLTSRVRIISVACVVAEVALTSPSRAADTPPVVAGASIGCGTFTEACIAGNVRLGIEGAYSPLKSMRVGGEIWYWERVVNRPGISA